MSGFVSCNPGDGRAIYQREFGVELVRWNPAAHELDCLRRHPEFQPREGLGVSRVPTQLADCVDHGPRDEAAWIATPPLRYPAVHPTARAMGAVFGGLLAEGGLDVTLVDAWQTHVDAINAGGLAISGAGSSTQHP